MNRQIVRALAMLLLLSFLLPGPALAGWDEDKRTAEAAFEAIITGNANRYIRMNDAQFARVKDTLQPPFQPVLTVFDLELTRDEHDPDLIHYSCTLPGAAGVALTMLTGYFYKNMDDYCPRVPVSGTLRFTDGAVRRLSTENPDNPFYLMLSLRYLTEEELVMPADFKIFGNYSDTEFPVVLEALTRTVSEFYGDMLGQTGYYESAAKADMESVVQNLDVLTAKSVTVFDAIMGDYLDLKWNEKVLRDITSNSIWLFGIIILASLVIVPIIFLMIKKQITARLVPPAAVKPDRCKKR